LRRELESLLGFETEAANFIETPAVHLAAEMLAEDEAKSKAGQMIGLPDHLKTWRGRNGRSLAG
jgi:hypothetical protein